MLTQHGLLRCFPAIPLFLFFFFFFWGGGGFGAVNPGQVHSPLAAFLVSLLSFVCLIISVVFGLGWTCIIFVMKWIKRGNLCQFIMPNHNPNKNALQTQSFPQVASSQSTASTGSIRAAGSQLNTQRSCYSSIFSLLKNQMS